MNKKTVGIAMIVIGVLMMAFTGFNVITREKVVDIGELEIMGNRNHWIEWPPIVGGLLAAAGVVVLLTGKRTV